MKSTEAIKGLMKALDEKTLCRVCDGRGMEFIPGRYTHGGYQPDQYVPCKCDNGRDWTGMSEESVEFCRSNFGHAEPIRWLGVSVIQAREFRVSDLAISRGR